jgi:hypothetical protein
MQHTSQCVARVGRFISLGSAAHPVPQSEEWRRWCRTSAEKWYCRVARRSITWHRHSRSLGGRATNHRPRPPNTAVALAEQAPQQRVRMPRRSTDKNARPAQLTDARSPCPHQLLSRHTPRPGRLRRHHLLVVRGRDPPARSPRRGLLAPQSRHRVLDALSLLFPPLRLGARATVPPGGRPAAVAHAIHPPAGETLGVDVPLMTLQHY